MNYGPLIFLAAFFALASSWLGFVLAPQMQVGHLQQTNGLPAGVVYPAGRSGLAREGLEVYRANGCAYCHSQQVTQTGTVCDVLLSEPGTNRQTLLTALLGVRPELSEAEAQTLVSDRSKPILRGVTKMAAEAAAKALTTNGAKASVWVVPVGSDIARGWGKRRSVAQDFLFDSTVMPGSLRVGPDLANIGVRQPDPDWQLRHLYAPAADVKGSTMPAYRFLFELRKIDKTPSPDALQLPPPYAPPPEYEIVPRPEARSLTAYLISLRADQPLFEAPLSSATPSATGVTTNAPSASESGPSAPPSTNQPAK